jgi:uncharacterized protein
MPMSPEERQMLTQLFERVRSQAGAPREQDAEALIADAVRAQPYAPYLLAQAVLVQEQALKGADQKIRELESRLAQAEQAAQAAQEQPRSGGFLGGLFGGGAAPRQAPPSPWGQANQPAPPQGGPWGQQGPQGQPPQPGPWGAPQAQGGGNSFLKGALGAAAGVAGGVLLADTLKGVFGGGHGGGGLGAGGLGNTGLGGGTGGETIVNNYYGDDQQRGGGQDDGYQQADYQDDDGYSSGDDYEA